MNVLLKCHVKSLWLFTDPHWHDRNKALLNTLIQSLKHTVQNEHLQCET